ncbi:MAG TPA: PH domain-containing protein [Candidatus Limnocylindria bacterium]|nr:PH domain-containing protein [Candidatus Limnocylindria bacterium]
MNRYFKVSVARFMPLVSILVIGLLLIVGVVHVLRAQYGMALIPLSFLVVLSLLAIRGYSIADGKLRIHRLGWRNEVSLSGLLKVETSPDLLRGAFALWAIRGIFGTDGYCYSRSLGWFRTYTRDSRNAVLLEFRDAKRIVVTPESPGSFAEAVRAGMPP